jgi:hypothetical protein
MSESHPMLQVLGLENAPADEPSADVTDPTAAAAEDGELISLDEAMAALDGEDAPLTPEASVADDASPPVLLSPEQVALLVQEVEFHRAVRAQDAAAAQDAQFDKTWDDHIERGYDWYDGERERIQAMGREQGRTQDEIDLAIYRRVEQGIGLIDRRTGAPVLGEREWERQTLANRASGTKHYLASKNAPSALDQMSHKYGLDGDDRLALAKFVTLPPDAFEAIAQTLGAKNQRLGTSLSQITQQANRNVAAHLANGIAPGAPGASAPQKRVALDHTRKSTEYVGKLLGFVR